MILYLSNKSNINLFDFLQEEINETVKVLAGEINLKNFLLRDVKNLSHCKYIIIDHSCLTDTNDDILEAIESFNLMYSIRLIFFLEGLNRTDKFILELINRDIFNIIIQSDIEKIKKDIRLCTSLEGKTYQDCLREFNINNEIEYEFSQDVQIAFCGVNKRVGTTTAAMNMANFLAARGAAVAYIELGQNNLEIIKKYYEIPELEGKTQWKGVHYYNKISELEGEYNFKIYDIGVITPSKIEILDEFKKTIICSQAKPYELLELSNAFQLLDKQPNIEYYINFASPVDKEKIKSLLNSNNKISFSNYSPNLFNGELNKDLFFNILQGNGYMKEIIV